MLVGLEDMEESCILYVKIGTYDQLEYTKSTF